MNLFRSEEHVRHWAQYNPASEEGLISLKDLVAVFSTESRRHLLDRNYISRWLPERRRERREALEKIGKAVPYWLG
jgi:hypothetical protein